LKLGQKLTTISNQRKILIHGKKKQAEGNNTCTDAMSMSDE